MRKEINNKRILSSNLTIKAAQLNNDILRLQEATAEYQRKFQIMAKKTE